MTNSSHKLSTFTWTLAPLLKLELVESGPQGHSDMGEGYRHRGSSRLQVNKKTCTNTNKHKSSAVNISEQYHKKQQNQTEAVKTILEAKHTSFQEDTNMEECTRRAKGSSKQQTNQLRL